MPSCLYYTQASSKFCLVHNQTYEPGWKWKNLCHYRFMSRNLQKSHVLQNKATKHDESSKRHLLSTPKKLKPTTVTVTIFYTNRLNEGNLTSLVALFNVQNFAHQIITHDQKRSSEKWCVKKENRITSRPKEKNRLFNLDNFKVTLEINANRKYVQLCKIDITKNRVLYTTQYTW